MDNLMFDDLLQTTAATLAFALFLLPPGYLLGLASNWFGFRIRSTAEKLLFSAAYSVAVTPILAVLMARFVSFTGALVVFILLALVSAGVLIRKLHLPEGYFSGVRRSTWIMLAIALAWFVMVQLSVLDLRVGNRLYISYLMYDHSVRVPFVESCGRTGVPPLNPFYGLGEIPRLRYYYYWYVVCALPLRLFGLSARSCLYGSIVWSGISLAALIPLFLKNFFNETENLRVKSVIGVALLSVTGLDLLPYAVQCISAHALSPDLEWWDTSQVTSWLGSLLWVPHHVAALTACMAGLLMIATIDEEMNPSRRAWAIAVPGMAFASAAGLSLYVAFSFALFALVWSGVMLLQKQFKTVASYAASGAFAVLLSLPYLFDLLGKGGDGQAGDSSAASSVRSFAYFAIRDNLFFTRFLRKAGFQETWITLTKLPALFVIYFLEFGFFALVLFLVWRRDRACQSLGRQRKMAWTMFAVCLLAMSFLQSNSTGANDLGFRGILLAQFVLLLWAIPVVHAVFVDPGAKLWSGWSRGWVKPALTITMVLGIAATAWQLVIMRVYSPLADHRKLLRSETILGFPGFGERTYWLRDAFSRIDQATPKTAVVQYNPVRYEVYVSHLYSTRQAAVGDDHCDSVFGGDENKCRQVLPYFADLFNRPDRVQDWDVDDFCNTYHLSVLLATNADPVWRDSVSWVWTRPSLYSNPAVRVIPCGTASDSSPSR